MLAPVLVTPPSATGVVTLTEAKAQLRVDTTDEDTLITALIAVAVQRCDGWGGILGRCLATQHWKAYFPGFYACHHEWDQHREHHGFRTLPRGGLRLPLPPVTAIDSVTYYDAANTQQTLASTEYVLLEDLRSAYVAPKTITTIWPTTTAFREDAVAVTYTAGYTTVPAPIKQAILMMISDLYEHRETVVIDGRTAAIPLSATVDALLAPYRAGIDH